MLEARSETRILEAARAASVEPPDKYQSRRPELTYMDFPPREKHENISSLIARANSWLAENRIWKVVSCEAVPHPPFKTAVGAFRVVHSINAKDEITDDQPLLLRLWCQKRRKDVETPQRLTVVAFGPTQPVPPKNTGVPETFDKLFARISEYLQPQRKLGQDIINVELVRRERLRDLDFNSVRERNRPLPKENDSEREFIFGARVYLDARQHGPGWASIRIKTFTPSSSWSSDEKNEDGLLSEIAREKEKLLKDVEQFCITNRTISVVGMQSFQVPKEYADAGMTQVVYKRTQWQDSGNKTVLAVTYYDLAESGKLSDQPDVSQSRSFLEKLAAHVTGSASGIGTTPSTNKFDFRDDTSLKDLVFCPRVNAVTRESRHPKYGNYGVKWEVETAVDVKDDIFDRFRKGNGHFMGAQTIVMSFPSDDKTFEDDTLLDAYRNGPEMPQATPPVKWFSVFHVYAAVPSHKLSRRLKKKTDPVSVDTCVTS